MRYLIIPGIIVMIAVILRIIFERLKTVYEVQLFIRNRNGEVLLVYDQPAGRFAVPSRQVPFDEIPTKVVQTVVAGLFPDGHWDFDYQYHFQDLKYDRVRDDTGPMYVYDVTSKLKRKCVLCYAVLLKEYRMTYRFQKEYPYPEFYTLDEINRMDGDIQPEATVQRILQEFV